MEFMNLELQKTMNSTEATAANHEHCIKICNSLLRGEISAVDTYGQAMVKYVNSSVASELRRIRDEHTESVSRLMGNVRDMGGEPEHDAGAWGMFATAVQVAADLFGPESAIHSLQRGEEMGRKDYEAALADPKVMAECKVMIREELLPRVMNHIASLDRLEDIA